MGIVKQHLYEITDAFHAIDEMVNDGEIKAENIVDQIEAMEGEFKQKAIQVATIRQNINPVIGNIDTEIKRLQARKKALVNRKEGLSDYLQRNMSATGLTKIPNDLFNITLCKGKEVLIIDNQDDIDGEFVNVEVVETVDKKLLLKTLKEEREAMKQDEDYDANNTLIKGAHIERAKSFIKIG